MGRITGVCAKVGSRVASLADILSLSMVVMMMMTCFVDHFRGFSDWAFLKWFTWEILGIILEFS
jgi:hypothetical protein